MINMFLENKWFWQLARARVHCKSNPTKILIITIIIIIITIIIIIIIVRQPNINLFSSLHYITSNRVKEGFNAATLHSNCGTTQQKPPPPSQVNSEQLLQLFYEKYLLFLLLLLLLPITLCKRRIEDSPSWQLVEPNTNHNIEENGFLVLWR